MLEYQNIFATTKETMLQSQLKTSSDIVNINLVLFVYVGPSMMDFFLLQITLQSNEIGTLRLITRNHQYKIKELETKIEKYNFHSDKIFCFCNKFFFL